MNTNIHPGLGSSPGSGSVAITSTAVSRVPPPFSRGDILGSAHKARTMSATITATATATATSTSTSTSTSKSTSTNTSTSTNDVHPALMSPVNSSPSHVSGIISATAAVPETSPKTGSASANTATAGTGAGAGGNTTGVNGQANATSNGTTSDENPLKRRNTDATDYPRRRATIACEVCRSRKSRCDGGKPKCKLCAELGADCIYREPGIKLDAGDKLILERLSRIESLLQFAVAGGGGAAAPPSAAAAVSCGVFCTNGGVPDGSCGADVLGLLFPGGQGTMGTNAGAGGHMDPNQPFPSAAAGANSLGSSWPAPNTNSLSSMPRIHTNAALHLLQWPLIRQLVPQPPDPQILLHLELSREPLNSLTKTPCVDLSNTQAYTAAFFAHVNIWYACVNPYTWRAHYRTALSNGFREGPESCITLLVLALGQASLRGSISRLSAHDEPPGLQYFTAAWALLPGMMTANSVLAAQCHLLAAAYLFYLVRPLEAWNLLCMTSSKLQLLLMSPARVPASQRELVERIYWNTLLFESDLLAEMDLPHSGLATFEEHVSLPSGFEDDSITPPSATVSGPAAAAAVSSVHVDSDQVGHDDLWYFLADIALRRILNRVSQAIYARDAFAPTPALEPVVAELDFQLSQWYDSLPLPLQFPFARHMLQDPVQTVLRLKFFACRTIIYRPYVLAVLENESVVMDTVARENCIKCLEAAVRQLEHVTEHHHGHMPYLWQGALSIVSQTLLIMGASMCPSLMEIILTILPHSEALDLMINKVLVEVEHYGPLAPSLGLASDILKEAEIRRRAFLSGA